MKLTFIILTIVFSSFSTFAGELEEQRKYIFNNQSTQFEEFIQDGYLNGLSVKGHSTYEYFDMYLDTPDLQLYKNNLSLRLRKRVFSSGEIEYGIQLKSEMSKNGQARMEVEEDDLKFYNIYYNHMSYNLQTILSEVFQEFEVQTAKNPDVELSSNPYLINRLDILKTWINFKINAPIAPFQKLKRMGINNISNLRPTTIGKSIRKRSHIFINLENTTEKYKDATPSTRSQLATPTLVKGNKKIWTMESSLDLAIFYDIVSNCSKVSIQEFEVENKYLPNENGVEFIQNFEKDLKNSFNAIVNLESKYKQTMNILNNCNNI